MADVVGRVISGHLKKNNMAKQSLVSVSESYFEEMGIDNDNALAIMQESDWMSPEWINTDYKPITTPVLQCLRTVFAYIRKVIDSSYYFGKSATFKGLHAYIL